MSGNWFLKRDSQGPERGRLFCLPHAGAGAAAYLGWSGELGHGVSLWAVQLPGREARLGEPALASLPLLVDTLLPLLAPHCGLPYALYGHSMGAFVAFELAQALALAGVSAPRLLVVSGARAPHLPPLQPLLCEMADDALLAEVQRRYGSAVEPEMQGLMRLMLPTLRADLAAVERRTLCDNRTLSMPLLALGGSDDAHVPLHEARQWGRYCVEGFEFKAFPGGHFFPSTARALFLPWLARRLQQHLL